ncbi:11793_t:CDS:2 [Acaulospora colombiana]|uniref:11793_t:CDS:1 n=1 Tax=Acaulospora colombiana TaxID=27376 RepID=A0ACA9PKV3_9GLOM|nr:11793_t:CDS:2 [Acaulospora colombiana]
MFRHRAQLSIQGGWIYAKIPTKMHWAPGTHVFVRFASIRPLESHPFTIYSIPSSDGQETNEMVLIIRPENGFTDVLAKAAEKSDPQDKFLVILDGPYGEVGFNALRSYEHVLLLAAGTGITFVAPILFDIILAMKKKEGPCLDVELTWVVKHTDDIKRFESEFLEAKAAAEQAGGKATISVHNIVFRNGRPDIPTIVSSKGNTWTGRFVDLCPLSLTRPMLWLAFNWRSYEDERAVQKCTFALKDLDGKALSKHLYRLAIKT